MYNEMLCLPTVNEIWLPIKGYEGLYEVSNIGRIKSLSFKYTCMRWGKSVTNTVKEIIMIPTIHTAGYYRIGLRKNRHTKRYYVHQLVATAFHPNPENKKEVNHLYGIKTDNWVNVLEWTTKLENMRHAFATNLYPSGELRPEAKLTNAQAIEIKSLYATGKYSQYKIGKMYNVCQRVINRIIRGVGYKNATP